MKSTTAQARPLPTSRSPALIALAASFLVGAAIFLTPRISAAQEAPDVMIKRAVTEVTKTIDADKDIQAGNRQKVTALINAKVIPFLDLQTMTRAAAGRHWQRATPEQQQALTREFSRLLINTYAGAFSSYRPETVIEYKPFRMQPADNDAVVRSLVVSKGGGPMQLDYYVERINGEWKVTDINVLGARLVETYKNQFNGAIAADGIDGLIKTLAARNKSIEERNRT